MIHIHRICLVTPIVKRVGVALTIGILVILLLIGDYQEPLPWLMYHQDLVLFEYRMQAVTILKVVTILWMCFLWMYATRWNQYDVYAMSRFSKQRVIWTRYLVVLEQSILFASVQVALLLSVQLFYPYELPGAMISSLIGNVVLFCLYFNTLWLALERWIQHLYTLFLPLLGYLIAMLFGDGLMPTDGTFEPRYLIHIIAPDVLVTENGYTFYFGPFVVLIMITILLQIVGLFVARQDGIRTN